MRPGAALTAPPWHPPQHAPRPPPAPCAGHGGRPHHGAPAGGARRHPQQPGRQERERALHAATRQPPSSSSAPPPPCAVHRCVCPQYLVQAALIITGIMTTVQVSVRAGDAHLFGHVGVVGALLPGVSGDVDSMRSTKCVRFGAALVRHALPRAPTTPLNHHHAAPGLARAHVRAQVTGIRPFGPRVNFMCVRLNSGAPTPLHLRHRRHKQQSTLCAAPLARTRAQVGRRHPQRHGRQLHHAAHRRERHRRPQSREC